MFKNFMASLGIGSSKIDLVLGKQEYRIGEAVNGYLSIRPGKVDQQVNVIRVHFNFETRHEDKTHKYSVGSVNLPGFTIQGGGQPMQIPFQYQIPWHIPITRPGIRYYFSSELDIDMAVDPTDKDNVVIHPDLAMETVMRALGALGFQEKWASGSIDTHGQEFEYHPAGFLAGQIEELEIYYVHEEYGLRLYMEMDKRLRGLSGLIAHSLDLNEKRTSLFIPYEQINACTGEQVAHTANLLQNFLQQEVSSGSFTSGRHSHPPTHFGGPHHNAKHRGHGVATGFLGGLAAGAVLEELLESDGNEDSGGLFDFFGDSSDDE